MEGSVKMKESFVSRLRKGMEIRDMKQADLAERTDSEYPDNILNLTDYVL